MLQPEEKRFIRYWEEQREGGRWSYLLLYTLVGAFMMSLVLSIFLLLFYNIYYGSSAFWLVAISAFVLSFLFTFITWQRNEARWKKIIRREVENGKLSDTSSQ